MRIFHTLLVALGLAFLAWLVAHIGPAQLWSEFTALGWGLIPLLLGEGVAEMVHTIGWRHCLSGSLRALPWPFLFRVRMAGYAINYLTPTAAIGGEVTKAALLSAKGRGPEAVSGVLIGKVCFALAHLIFVLLGTVLIFWSTRLPPALWLAMLITSVLVGGGILAFLLIQKYGKLGTVIRWLAARKIGGHFLQRAAQRITEVDEAMQRFYRERPRDLLLALAWHLAGYSVGIAQTWLFLHLLGHDASLAIAGSAWFLGMWFDLLTFAVPLNLGTLEGTRVVAFKALGYGSVMGMTYGIALRLAQLLWAGFGLLSYALLASENRRTEKAGSTNGTSRELTLSRPPLEEDLR